jgi:hypothetical protein
LSSCWLGFRQQIQRCCAERRPFLPERSGPLSELPLLAQKVEALSIAIGALADSKPCFAITTDQVACIQELTTANGNCSKSMITDLLRLKYEMCDNSLSFFAETHKDIPPDVLKVLWDATPMSLFDPEQQVEQILDLLMTLTAREVTGSLFWVCCAQRLRELEGEAQEWMAASRERLVNLAEEVSAHSLKLFEEMNIETFTSMAARIGEIGTEIRVLNELAEQFSGSISVVLDLYYKGQAQATNADERKCFYDRIFLHGNSGRDRTIDVLVQGQTPDGGSCRMFVSQGEDRCMVATTIKSP